MKANKVEKLVFNRKMEPEGKLDEDNKTKERAEIFICIKEIKKIFKEISFPPPEQQTLFFSRFLTHIKTASFQEMMNLSDPSFPFPSDKKLMFIKGLKQNEVLRNLLERRSELKSPVKLQTMKGGKARVSSKARSEIDDSQIERDFQMMEMQRANECRGEGNEESSKVTLNLDSARGLADFSDIVGDGFLSSEDLISLKRLVEVFQEVEFNTQTPNDDQAGKGNEPFSLKNITEESFEEEKLTSQMEANKDEKKKNDSGSSKGKKEQPNLSPLSCERNRRERRISSLRDQKRKSFHDHERKSSQSAKEIFNYFRENKLSTSVALPQAHKIEEIRSNLEALKICEEKELGFTVEKLYLAVVKDGLYGLRLFRDFFLHDEWHAVLAHLRGLNLLDCKKDAEEELVEALSSVFNSENLTLRIGARVDLNSFLQELSYKIRQADSFDALDEYSGRYIPPILIARVKQKLAGFAHWSQTCSPQVYMSTTNLTSNSNQTAHNKGDVSIETKLKKREDFQTVSRGTMEPRQRFIKRYEKKEEDSNLERGLTGERPSKRENMRLVSMPERRPEAEKNKEEDIFTAFGLGLFVELMQYGGKFEAVLLSKIVLDYFNSKDIVNVYEKWKSKKSAFSELVEFVMPSTLEDPAQEQARRENQIEKFIQKIQDKEVWYSLTYFFKAVFSAEIKNRKETLIKFNKMIKDERAVVKELCKIFRVNGQLRIFDCSIKEKPKEVILCSEGCGEKNIFVNLATELASMRVFLKSSFAVNIF